MRLFTENFLLAISIFFIGILLSIIISRLSKNFLKKISKRTKTNFDDFIFEVIAGIIKPIGFLLSFYFSIDYFFADEITFISVLLNIQKLFILIIIIKALNKVIIRSLTESTSKIDDSSISSMISSLTPLIKALTWTIGSIFFLQNIGVQMTAIWALLSAGGIGAGLALKDPVQEFFEYITILLDKPFQKGEFIKSEGVLGMVERVGVRSSRIRSINGEVIVMSNSSLTNGIISNYAQMKKRRLVHKLGVVYETSPKLMKLIPTIIQKIVEETKDAYFDRCHFTDFGDFSLNFELVYYIPTNNYLAAMEAQQSINLKIIEEFAANKIEFAFPTQTLNIESNKAK
ncbi:MULTISPECIES: mechanosensitive ion channel family protein [Prochlorococcus]|uniref:mechanosensitive ion channel family protein n=1 Tax=Prochlorococcus TaxID=1218 RepID=UPI0005172319|nr:mechanosensitive ion channel family protein [Prochlorococcus marinus]KGF93408.1 Small mechanosensitive ion channel [Prochlorococcus marinus str. MIT 9123]